MKECYNLNEQYSIQEMEQIADIFYQRTKKISEFMQTTTDEVKRTKAERIFFILYFTVVKMTQQIYNASIPSKHFKEGGVVAKLNRRSL